MIESSRGSVEAEKGEEEMKKALHYVRWCTKIVYLFADRGFGRTDGDPSSAERSGHLGRAALGALRHQ